MQNEELKDSLEEDVRRDGEKTFSEEENELHGMREMGFFEQLENFFLSMCRISRDEEEREEGLRVVDEDEIETRRSSFLKVISKGKTDPTDMSELDAKKWTVKDNKGGNFLYESFKIYTESNVTAPVVVVKHMAKNSSSRQMEEVLPVILLLHQTGGSNEKLDKKGFFQRFARKGFLVVGVDCRYHGARNQHGSDGRTPYYDALVTAYENGGQEKPFIYDNIWDLMRVIDYLQSREDVNPSLIGSTGISLGGMHSWFLAFADPRIKAVAPAIGVQWFDWAVKNDMWQARANSIRPVFEAAAKKLGKTRLDAEVVQEVWSTICPGLTDEFDAPNTIPAIMPRPLLILNGELDERCPIEAVKQIFSVARTSYSRMNAENEIDLYIESGGQHAVSEPMWDEIEKFFIDKLKFQRKFVSKSPLSAKM